MENTDRITRIQTMETRFDQLLTTVAALDEAMQHFDAAMPMMEQLVAYYESDLWHSDFAADEAGELPADLKRGVLSEDGIYNLLTDIQRLKEQIQE